MNQPWVVLIVLGVLLHTSSCQPLPTRDPIPTSIPVPTASPTMLSVLSCTSTATSGLTLRAGPGKEYPAVLVLVPGAHLVAWVRSEDSAWLLGRTANGSTGWVTAAFVTCQGSASALPLVPEPPPSATPSPATR